MPDRGNRVGGGGLGVPPGKTFGGLGNRPPKRGGVDPITGEPLSEPFKDDPFAFLDEFLDYETPQEEITRRLNLLGQMLSAGQSRTERGFAERQAGRTGGRLGSSERGFQEIGGQFAQAGQLGSAQILNEAANQEIRMKLAGLQAYIQKYGIDKNVQLALLQLQQQRDAQEASLYGDIFGEFFKLLVGQDFTKLGTTTT